MILPEPATSLTVLWGTWSLSSILLDNVRKCMCTNFCCMQKFVVKQLVNLLVSQISWNLACAMYSLLAGDTLFSYFVKNLSWTSECSSHFWTKKVVQICLDIHQSPYQWWVKLTMPTKAFFVCYVYEGLEYDSSWESGVVVAGDFQKNQFKKANCFYTILHYWPFHHNCIWRSFRVLDADVKDFSINRFFFFFGHVSVYGDFFHFWWLQSSNDVSLFLSLYFSEGSSTVGKLLPLCHLHFPVFTQKCSQKSLLFTAHS